MTILILIHRTECLLCKGEPDEAILMLETYLPQVKKKIVLMNRKHFLSALHNCLMHCYQMKGDLSTAIQYAKYDAELLDGDPSLHRWPSYFEHNPGECSVESGNQDLRNMFEWRDKNEHKKEL